RLCERCTVHIECAGTTCGTAVRLSVISAVADVGILFMAVTAHDKPLHSGPFSVIGQTADDRITGAAVRAVDKRVAVSPIRAIVQLCRTFRTDGKIRRDKSTSRQDPALSDLESVIVSVIFFRHGIDLLDYSHGRSRRPDS